VKLLRWPNEDPRVVLVGRVESACLKWDMALVRLSDGPMRGCAHMAGQATEAFVEGELVALRGGFWWPV